MKRRIDLRALPTKSWRSHAFFRAGITAAAKGDHISAEALFTESLRDDPNNLAARVNFAGELMVDRNDDASQYRFAIEFAVEQLGAVLTTFKSDSVKDEVYYAALYRLASAHYDLGQTTSALHYARQLDTEIHAATDTCKKDLAENALQRRTNERLAAYFEQSHPAAEMMHIGMKLELRMPGTSLDDLRNAAKVRVPTAQFQYNYACALACYLPQVPGADDRAKLKSEAIQRVALAIRMKEDLRARAKVDRALTQLSDAAAFVKLVAKPLTPGASS